MSLPEAQVYHETCGCDHNGREFLRLCDKHRGSVPRGMKVMVDQPPPTPGQGDVWELVIADMKERRQTGIERYGTPLQPFNGRRALVDAYQEVLDLAVYLRQKIEEDTLGSRGAG